ncbi:MAG: AraC family transcriptional regulator [Carboxylicivirga sp.]|jgi:AraC-like DNA-binding protein|nr:AraC family transcriptional regulator [Carboxylicivirga sp.]
MGEKVLFNISIKYLLQNNIGSGLGSEIVITSQVHEYINLFKFPVRIDAILLLVCAKGSVDFSVNLKKVTVVENMYFVGLPENTFGLDTISDDFKGYAMLISMDYLRSISLDLKDVMPYYAYIRIQSCFKMDAAKVMVIAQYFELLSVLLNDELGNRKDEVVKGLIISMINKLSNDLDEMGIPSINIKTKSKEYYFMKFMELLLLNFREQHSVGFYSKKIGLSPKYLSALMKDVSGSSASDWINNYIVLEAKTLLKYSDMSIMQIADYLNFPNQSFFSKYFKHHVSKTPKQYRSV